MKDSYYNLISVLIAIIIASPIAVAMFSSAELSKIKYYDYEYDTYYNVTVVDKVYTDFPDFPYAIIDQNGREWYLDCSEQMFRNVENEQTYLTKIRICSDPSSPFGGAFDLVLGGVKYVKYLEIIYDVPNIYGVIEKEN